MARSSEIEDLLRGYVAPSPAQLKRWWSQAEIVIDANVLLNLYRYSAQTRDDLLDVLRALGDRLWIPRQAAKEFAEARPRVLASQISAQDKIRGSLDELIGQTSDRLRQINKDLSRRGGAPGHEQKATEALEALRDALLADERKLFGDDRSLANDPLLSEVKKLLQARIGDGLTDAEHEEWRQKGADRIRDGIPPGFGDGNKEGDKRFGDVFIWAEILRHADQAKKPVFFVTDDQNKGDWMVRYSGRTFGPHPLLVRELWQAAGVPLRILDTVELVRRAPEELSLSAKPRDTSVAEVEETTVPWSQSQLTPHFVPARFRPRVGSRAQISREISERGGWPGSRVQLDDAPLLTSAITTTTSGAILSLAKVPAGALACTVMEPDDSHSTAERRLSDNQEAVIFTYPDDFPFAQPNVSGVRRVLWQGVSAAGDAYAAGAEFSLPADTQLY
jgi:hypothetical protein